jgi:hypothetical protein
VLCIDDDVRVLEHQHQWSIDVEENSSVWMDLAPGTPAFKHVALFPFCCTAQAKLLVCHAHSYVINCDQLAVFAHITVNKFHLNNTHT